MEQDSKHPWYMLSMGIFVAVNLVAWWKLWPLEELQKFATPWHIVLFSLAVFRGADVISNEKITKPLRAPFIRMVEKDGKMVEEPRRGGFRGALGSLIYCPSCTGVWVAMIIVYAYLLVPAVTWAVVIIGAFSGLERVITTSVNYIKKSTQEL